MPRPQLPRVRCAAALLEVVLSLSILLIAMSVVGLTFRNGERSVELADQMTRGRLETDRLLAEMDVGILKMDQRVQSAYFGDEAPQGMSWRVEINPHEQIKGLLDVDIYIFLGDPDASAKEHQLVLYTRVQRPEPKGIDFEKDYGLDPNQVQTFTNAIPGGSALFDPTNFDPRLLASMPMDQLVEMLPALVQMFGGSLGGNAQLDAILQAIQKGDMSALQNLAQQALDQAGSQGGKGSSAGGTSSGGGQGKAPQGGSGGAKQPQNPIKGAGGGK